MRQFKRLWTLGVMLLVSACTPSNSAYAQQAAAGGGDIATASTVASPGNVLTDFDKVARKSVAIFYSQDYSGSFAMRCTATAFEREGNIVRFVTASHCNGEDDTLHEKAKEEIGFDWYVTFDETGPEKKMIRAKVVALGYRHAGHDFVVLETEIKEPVQLMPLADADPDVGEEVVNFATPRGLGIQTFKGHVSLARSDRPLAEDDINWRNAMMLQMNAGPGSSGSAVISSKQRGIVGFLVGGLGESVVAIPVSSFRTFWTEVKYGQYRYYKSPNPPKKKVGLKGRRPAPRPAPEPPPEAEKPDAKDGAKK